MKTKIGIAIAVCILTAIPMTSLAQPRVSFQMEFGAPPVNRHYISLGESYDVPYQDICLMHDAGVVDADIPAILYIYTHSQYSLRQIYSLRLRGATWDQLSNWCGVPLSRDRSGPPHGNAYGYYSHGPGKHWNGPAQVDGEGNGHHGKWMNDHRGRGRYQEDR